MSIHYTFLTHLKLVPNIKSILFAMQSNCQFFQIVPSKIRNQIPLLLKYTVLKNTYIISKYEAVQNKQHDSIIRHAHFVISIDDSL